MKRNRMLDWEARGRHRSGIDPVLSEVDPVLDVALDVLARAQIATMSPLEMGQLVYPQARPVPIEQVPDAVVREHLTRYSRRELERGQFFEVVQGKFTFFMDHEAKRKREASS
ncbi:MAG: hypothetical protein SX243_01620 [Acidobacteriota bacterium]|nr:hypothetical protein [Acidobacteriota bacterium]